MCLYSDRHQIVTDIKLAVGMSVSKWNVGIVILDFDRWFDEVCGNFKGCLRQ